MLSITLGLGLVLLGIYFNSLFTTAIGFFCMLLGLYSSRARPVKEPQGAQHKENRKTRHIVIASEPPEITINPWETGRLPIDISKETPDFLPLPDYGYSDPLEKIFLGLPIRFLKKV